MQTLTVSEISKKIKSLIETGIPYVQIEGEISNYKPHHSGHAYFTLKDEYAQISVVMWKSNFEQLLFELEDGKHVLCSGRISVYERSGRYQLVANQIDQIGFGELQRKFEELKRKLYDQGYFDESIKKQIPKYPQTIGLVTSPTGAAIQDFVSVLQRRNPTIQIILRPAKVQGNGAAADIADAINEFNDYSDVDVVIVGRGGGSLEDLWAFNEQIVADAIFESDLPIISAVGHEIDVSISDFVADYRAATPSAAAELVSASREDMMQAILYYREKIDQFTLRLIDINKDKLLQLKTHYALKQPESLIAQQRSLLENLKQKSDQYIGEIMTDSFNQLMQLKKQIKALGPQQILNRGYSLIHQDQLLVSSKEKLISGEVEITFKDGKTTRQIS